MDKLLEWAKAHPVWLGVGVFAVGLALLWLFGFFSSSSSATSSSGNSVAADYYAAETAAQTAATQQQGQQQAAQVQVAGINASEDVAIAQSNNQLAGIQAQTSYLSQVSSDAVTMNAQNTASAQAISQITANAQEGIATTQAAQAIGVANAAAETTINQDAAAVETVDLQNSTAAYLAYLQAGKGGAQLGEGPSAFRQTNIGVQPTQ